jgi:hypothetical protein
MDAGAHKSSVFSALTRPVADFERDQAAAALPAITETATLRRIAEQAATQAEATASRAPADQQEERQAEAIARTAEAANLLIPPIPRWLVDDATPEALAGLLATYGRIALLSPEGDVFNQMAGRYNQTVGPNLGVYLKGHAGDLLKVDRRGRPPNTCNAPASPSASPSNPTSSKGWPAAPDSGVGGCWPGSSTASRRAWSAAASPGPHPSPSQSPTAGTARLTGSSEGAPDAAALVTGQHGQADGDLGQTDDALEGDIPGWDIGGQDTVSCRITTGTRSTPARKATRTSQKVHRQRRSTPTAAVR